MVLVNIWIGGSSSLLQYWSLPGKPFIFTKQPALMKLGGLKQFLLLLLCIAISPLPLAIGNEASADSQDSGTKPDKIKADKIKPDKPEKEKKNWPKPPLLLRHLRSRSLPPRD